MRLKWTSWRRHDRETTPNTAPETTTDDEHHEQIDALIAEEWAALSDAERADISAALVEQREVMDKYGIIHFHFCERGGWNTPQPLIRSAETIRAQTHDMHALFDTANGTS